MNVIEWKEKNLLNPSQFAKKVKVGRATVQRVIKNGNISVYQIGKEKNIFIDYEQWKDYPFDESKKRFQKITPEPIKQVVKKAAKK